MSRLLRKLGPCIVGRLPRLLGLLAVPSPAAAHPGADLVPGEFWGAWTWDPWVLLAIGAPAWLYGRGAGRVWARAGAGHGVPNWRFHAFHAGLAVLFLALISPIHALGGALFAAHMLQHELLILVAAPLIALGAPVVAFAWALPPAVGRAFARLLRTQPFDSVWRLLAHPLGAWAVHALALWAWHLPGPYQATLSSDLAHAAQHVSFFASALLFWWVVFDPRRSPIRYGVGILLTFTTMLHSNLLGALLTFSAAPWYPAYERTAPRWGLSALEDQQLGGLIMWVPAGMVYLGIALLLLAAWLRLAEARVGP